MMDWRSVLAMALPVFVMLGLGMLCRKKALLARSAVDGLKRVAVDICLPAVLFKAFATADYAASTVAIAVAAYFTCILMLGLGFLLVKLMKIPGRTAPFLASGFEVGMLGYALFMLLFPGESTSKLAILDTGLTLFVFTFYKGLVAKGKMSGRELVGDMLRSPVLWALILGVLAGSTGLMGVLQQADMTKVLFAVADFVGAPTGGIILLAIGYDLVLGEIPWKQTARLLVMRLLTCGVFLVLLLALNKTLLPGLLFPGAVAITAILPPPYVLPIFADDSEERVQTASALSASTLITLILFVVLAVIYSL